MRKPGFCAQNIPQNKMYTSWCIGTRNLRRIMMFLCKDTYVGIGNISNCHRNLAYSYVSLHRSVIFPLRFLAPIHQDICLIFSCVLMKFILHAYGLFFVSYLLDLATSWIKVSSYTVLAHKSYRVHENMSIDF